MNPAIPAAIDTKGNEMERAKEGGRGQSFDIHQLHGDVRS